MKENGDITKAYTINEEQEANDISETSDNKEQEDIGRQEFKLMNKKSLMQNRKQLKLSRFNSRMRALIPISERPSY
ncbi:22421_t:CDS:2 [Cetraspora pellucida]|uniref:22421_t:CDS:1 n=1 Tax=Cetraspora pellucida TaxID=1433469 RepID=A0A9N9HB05_9GLOM|nr:22421_t:CDS:2 [Cetraspora pellucida]